ncbi:MAG: ribosome biogenesis GTP-binding protein YihA/YsxC [Staphylococcus sp.]|jgi:ribosome biogenesis GTP-binding protein ysxC|nr:ribosome biogenesis GTP-binding protein YihA/YsxC [Staphylococcus sp.]
MIIKKAEYLISGTKFEHFPKLNYPEFVFIGRSNVGKSSLLNAITNRKNLAYTSSKPGKTITLNFYNVNDEILLVDVPGYGYAEKVKYDRLAYGKMIENYLNYSKNLISCFLIIDSRHKPSEDDILMYKFLKHLEKQIVIITTKIDKISKNELQKNLALIKKTLNLETNDLVFCVSSEKRIGIDSIHSYIESKVSKIE